MAVLMYKLSFSSAAEITGRSFLSFAHETFFLWVLELGVWRDSDLRSGISTSLDFMGFFTPLQGSFSLRGTIS